MTHTDLSAEFYVIRGVQPVTCLYLIHLPIVVRALQSQQGGIFGLFGGASQSNTGHNIV